jgi:hypothetical protein
LNAKDGGHVGFPNLWQAACRRRRPI